MPIFTGSRYAQEGKVLGVVDEDDRVRRFVFSRKKFERDELGEAYDVYTIQDGDRIDELANRFGGDARMWWLIADVNNMTDFPDDLTPGDIIIIPWEEIFKRIA